MKKTYLAVIVIQAIYAGMNLLSKAAFDGGMNNFIFVFYRQAAATAFLVPVAVFLEWKTAPPLSFVTFCKIFLLSLCGITLSLDIYGIALVYTSATLAAATTNCLPVITFFLALLFGMEALKLRTKPGIGKLIGIIICITGVSCLAFFKGPHFRILWHFHPFGDHHHSPQHPYHLSAGKSWIKGVFLMLLSNFFWGSFLVFQVEVMKSYPSKLLLTALQCLLSSVQSFAIAVAMERHPSQWELRWNVRLLAVAYCGIVVTGVTYYMQAWVIEKKGPVFLAMSTPLALIITILCSAILLGEVVTLGSILGGFLLILGLYSVLWGKSREQNTNAESSLPAEKESLELKEIVTKSII
ncbi:Plant-drug/metabolite exporter [Parasponia andersonii]|uniref:WAT1-related protein n=1 Tax=Parasponia andersonii TaxID=3476 RepID=A0A2P5B827_PARAD|nr:Plant-drug/metabolite exporter [Parasponia andersonii]